MTVMLHEEKPSIDDALEHYGVKGMKWGVRKARETGGAVASTGRKLGKAYKDYEVKQARWKPANKHPGYSKGDMDWDKAVLGRRSVERINARMHKGNSYRTAYYKEVGRKTVITFAALEAVSLAGIGVQALQSNPQLQSVLLKGAAEAGKIFFGDAARAESHGLPAALKVAKTVKGAYKVTSLR